MLAYAWSYGCPRRSNFNLIHDCTFLHDHMIDTTKAWRFDDRKIHHDTRLADLEFEELEFSFELHSDER